MLCSGSTISTRLKLAFLASLECRVIRIDWVYQNNYENSLYNYLGESECVIPMAADVVVALSVKEMGKRKE